MTPKIIWITGANGFSAKYLIQYIKECYAKAHIIAIDIGLDSSNNVDQHVKLDITDLSAITKLAERHPPEWVFHLAGALPWASEKNIWQVNVSGMCVLLQSLYNANCGKVRILSVGSAAEYLPKTTGFYNEEDKVGGVSTYGMSKTAQSILAINIGKSLGFEVIVPRTFNLIGPGMSRNLVVGNICAQIATDKKSITLGNIESKRDFVDIRDVVKAYLGLMEKAKPNTVYNVSSGTPIAIRDIVDLASEIVGKKLNITIDHNRINNNEINISYGNNHKINQEIGWGTEIFLKDSITNIIDSFI